MEIILNNLNHPLIFITGPSCSGKSYSINKILPPSLTTCHVSCIERYSCQLLFENILLQYSGITPSAPNYNIYSKCSDIQDFINILLQLLDTQDTIDGTTARYLILDNCDALDPQTCAFMMKLPQLSNGKIQIIMISRLAWQDLITICGNSVPAIVQFKPYSKDQILDIIALDCPPQESPEFYKSFAKIIYETFSRPCRNLNELRHLVSVLFPKYLEPVYSGKVSRDQTSKLLGIINPRLKSTANSLYTRQMSSTEFTSANSCSTIENFDLPYYTRYLLISAFLASFNPPRLDMRFFSKGKEEKIKKSRKNMSQNGTKTRQQLLGPRTFTLERMLGIFYSIIEDPIEDNVAISLQVSTLISLGLINRTSNADLKLDNIKLKCCASYNLVKQVSKSLGFQIVNYLYNWIDVE